MNIHYTGYPVAVSQQLATLIDQERQAYDDSTWLGFIMQFRPPDLDAKKESYHAVEITVDAQDRIKTITHFAYFNQGWGVTLGKELDFDFFYEQFQQRGQKYPIQNGARVFETWQTNFCTCYQQQVYAVTILGL